MSTPAEAQGAESMEEAEKGKDTKYCPLGMTELLHTRAHRSCGYLHKIVLIKNSSVEERASEAVAEEQFMADGDRESVIFLWWRVAFGRLSMPRRMTLHTFPYKQR